MKTKFGLALVAGALLMNVGVSPGDWPRFSLVGGATVQAQDRIDYSFFYEELGPYGDWRRREPYGWVWYPTVDKNWRPYTFGYWVFTDDYGWTWVSQDPWGSMPFHYGRWFYDTGRRGWAWVPGTEWGPAWVGWRSGGGFIGWAPLPPDIRFDPGVGFAPPGPDFGSRWNSWSFVPSQRFLHRRLNLVIVSRSRNTALLNRTTNATRYHITDRRIVNLSIDPRRFEEETRTRIIPYQVDEINRPLRKEPLLQNGRVILFRPEVVRTAVEPPPPPLPPPMRPPRPGSPPSNSVAPPGPPVPPPGDQRPIVDQEQRNRGNRLGVDQPIRPLPPSPAPERNDPPYPPRPEPERALRPPERHPPQRPQPNQRLEQEQARQQAEQEQVQRARQQAEEEQIRRQQFEQEQARQRAEQERAQREVMLRQQAEQEQARQRAEQEHEIGRAHV